ncbi:hypothetical protein BRC90_04910 [Halobacteriales archaeon QS_4_69_34]|nr:MAG: hypothetical protein BRC90_04910 [Halobacteriales archaeon QS_4_69_34]
MQQRRRALAAAAATVGLFLLVQLGALALVAPFDAAGFQATEDPSDPTNSALYLGVILVATAAMLGAIRLGARWLLRGVVLFASGLMALYVFLVLLPPWLALEIAGGVNVPAFAAAGGLVLALYRYPEWYVIDAAGVVMGAGAAALFGISFGLLPAIALLAALAVYDAVSVYGTEHMLALADGVMELKLPVVLVVPLALSYSFLDGGAGDASAEDEGAESGTAESTTAEGADGENATARTDERDTPATPDGGESDDERSATANESADAGDRPTVAERDALFVGLGDAVMPTVMVASAAAFAPAPSLGVSWLPALTLPALSAMVGTLAGLGVLLWLVLRGRAHAGLPLLNGGAIGGYLLGALASGIPLVRALGLGPYL